MKRTYSHAISMCALTCALAAALLPTTASAEDLLQTYQLAREGDPSYSIAESSRLATREGAVQARAAMLPNISGNARFSRSRSDTWSSQTLIDPVTQLPYKSTSEGSGTRRARDLDLSARQMVFDMGSFSRLKSQNAISQASDFQLQSAGNSLITRTSQAYFNVLVALETLNAAEAQEKALKKQFDFADKRLEVGLAPITDVHEARARYDAARANTLVVRNALEDAYQALAEITGKEVRALMALPQDFKPVMPGDHDADGWVAAAVDNNPALKAKQFQLQAAESDVSSARAGYFPTVYASAGYGDSRSWSESSARGLRLPSENAGRGPSIGLTLSVPIFDGGLTASRVRQSLAQRDITQDELEQQKRALIRNTRNAYQALLAGISEVEARRLAVVSARSAYEASQVGLEVGTRTVLDVLNNQQLVFNAEREYALSRYNFLQNRLLLEQAAGTLDVSDVQDINRLLTEAATVPASATGGP